MLLSKVAICDFRSFQGLHEIDLAPRTKYGHKRPIVLFGGLNGAGKTSILTAVRLALYGQLALDGRATAKDYERFLADSIHKNPNTIIPADNAYVEVHFNYGKLGERFNYRIQRSWSHKGSRVQEKLRVWKNDEQIRGIDRAEAQTFLNELVPLGVSDLFFFDGEKIAELAEDQDGSALGEAIRRLVGIDLADRLRADLGVYLRRQTAKRVSAADKRKLGHLHKQYDAAKKTTDRLERKVETETERLATLKEVLGRKEQDLRSLGGQFADSRDQAKEELEQLRQTKNQAEVQVRELAAGLLPFTLAQDALCDSIADAAAESEQARAQERAAHLSELATTLLSEAEQTKTLSKKGANWLEKRLRAEADRQVEGASGRSHRYRYEAGTREIEQWRVTSGDLVPAARSTATDALKMLGHAVDEIDVLEVRLARAPAEERLETAFDAMKSAQAACDKQTARLAAARAEYAEALKDALQLGRELKRFTQQISAHEATERPVEYAQATRELLAEYSTLVSRAKVKDLEAEFDQAFRRLARKDDLHVRAQIDASSYQVHLVDERGNAINRKQLSAGERQIYAIAMLEALAHTSGRRLPVIIDTPLGRLDSHHRTKLVEHYFPRASHQVLILSTDTEVDASFYQALSSEISHAYEIRYDSEARSSELREGYFWRHLEAVPEAS